MDSSGLSQLLENQSSQENTPPTGKVSEKTRVRRVTKAHDRDVIDDASLHEWIAFATQEEEEFMTQFREVGIKLSTFYDAIANVKDELTKHIDERVGALERRIAAIAASASDSSATPPEGPVIRSHTPDILPRPPIPQFFSSHSPTPNVNSSFSSPSPGFVSSPLRLGVTGGNSALAAALELIFASVWVSEPIQQCPGILSDFSRNLETSHDAACFSLLQNLEKVDTRFLSEGSAATAFDYFISLLRISENEIAAPNTTIGTQECIRGRESSEELLLAFKESEIAREDTPIQRQCQFEVCEERECRCGKEVIYNSVQFLRITAPQTGRRSLEELVHQQYGGPLQGKCTQCSGLQMERAIICSPPNELFIVFDSLMHGEVLCDELITLYSGEMQENVCRYRINAAIVYSGNTRYSAHIVAEDGVRWLCDEQTIVERPLEVDAPGMFCLSYSRLEK